MTARDDYPAITMVARGGDPPYDVIKRECERALTEIDDLRKIRTDYDDATECNICAMLATDRDDALGGLRDAEAEIARLRKHSVILNSVAWRISEALGKVGADDTEVLGDAQADLEELISQLEACTA